MVGTLLAMDDGAIMQVPRAGAAGGRPRRPFGPVWFAAAPGGGDV